MRAFARVVVLDDQQKHLDIIVRALGKAGFGAISYLVEDGAVTPEVVEPCNGLRLIFSDIHLTPTSGISGIDNIGILGPFLRNITTSGPYGLIFWSKFAEDEAEIVQTLKDRAQDLGIQLPVFFGFIDKKAVLTDLDDEAEEVEETTPNNFRNLILAEIAKCPTLRAVMEWEERAFLAANSVSNSLFKISESPQNGAPEDSWSNLIAFLAQEAVGKTNAQNDPLRAIDNALLPILEDQFRYSLPSNTSNAFDQIKEKLSGSRLSLPPGVSPAKLHSYYLVETLTDSNTAHQLRGTISAIEKDDFDKFFSQCFASKWRNLMLDEFIVQGPNRETFEEARKDKDLPVRISPCLIALSPECDDVQGKVVTQRYLLGVILNNEDARFCEHEGKLARDALHSIGKIEYNGSEKLIIVSCRRFLAIPTSVIKSMPLTPLLRLRRAMIDELSHHYTTYTRRPGVMRFS
ncbi:hypothetical protein C5612_24280 [Pseudomonas frederiksbergensis]|uniref:Uncharacterized protein n=1 Tax=Pseudomonas frederiksbergensis TaxID=104087 RepID=A0A2S8HC44_9PSED|nr:hypothetical protein [Pseudomonas frederiksbergensis]PQP00066.1 hypothetical protein C5612_24280 [Pseudomonas frederiksbergensis]